MVSNGRSLTNQKDGLGNLLNLTNKDFYVRLMDEKPKKTRASLQAVPSPSSAHFDFPPSLPTPCHAGYANPGLKVIQIITFSPIQRFFCCFVLCIW